MEPAASRPPRINEFGQPVGVALPGWRSPPFPPHVEIPGRYGRIEPLLAARHARELFEAQLEDAGGASWTYLSHGPYTEFAPFETWCIEAGKSRDPQFYAIVDAGGQAVGMAAYMRMEPRQGVIEVGNIYFSPRLAQTRAATEAIYLFLANAFALGYRRFEWKCDSCNLPSRAAARRFGFSYEGLFRQAIVNKGRNRDTAWFSIIDADWNRGLKDAYLQWLDPDNFNPAGRQKSRLSVLTAPFAMLEPACLPPDSRESGCARETGAGAP